MADPYCEYDTVLVLLAALLTTPALRHVLTHRTHMPHSIGPAFHTTLARLACLAALVLAHHAVPRGIPVPDHVFARALAGQVAWMVVVAAGGVPVTVVCMVTVAALAHVGVVVAWMGGLAAALRCAHVLGWTRTTTTTLVAAVVVTAAVQLALGSFVLLG